MSVLLAALAFVGTTTPLRADDTVQLRVRNGAAASAAPATHVRCPVVLAEVRDERPHGDAAGTIAGVPLVLEDAAGAVRDGLVARGLQVAATDEPDGVHVAVLVAYGTNVDNKSFTVVLRLRHGTRPEHVARGTSVSVNWRSTAENFRVAYEDALAKSLDHAIDVLNTDCAER